MAFLPTYRAAWFHRYDDEQIIPQFSCCDYPGMTERPFACEARPGVTARGHFYRMADVPTRPELVLFLHGLGGDHRTYMPEIACLCGAGYEVLAVDNPGCGESDGEGVRCLSEAIVTGDKCLEEIARTEKRPIIIIGHSWGAFAAGVLAAMHPELKKALLLAPFDSAVDFAESFFPQHDGAAEGAIALESEFYPEYAAAKLSEMLAGATVPTMVAASLDDPMIPIMRGLVKIQKALDNPAVTYLRLQGRGHTPTYTEEAVTLSAQFTADFAHKVASGILETLEEKQAYAAQFNFEALMAQDEKVWEKLLAFLEK